MSDQLLYVYADGDDVGKRLELLLLDNDVNFAAQYSRLISDARINLELRLLSLMSGRTIFSAGDELLVLVGAELLDIPGIRFACGEFEKDCGQRVSIGIGPSTALAATSLRRAKLLGKGRIVYGREVTSSAPANTDLHLRNFNKT
jgi:hypothetical protein